MEEYISQIIETDWGLSVVLKKGLTINDSNIIPALTFILDKCKEIKKNKVIVDATWIQRHASAIRFLELAEIIQKEYKGIKIAFIAPHLADRENSKAMETFSFNRGVSLQYFPNLDSALDWLLK